MGSYTIITLSSPLHAARINSSTLSLQQKRRHHEVKKRPRVVAYYGLKKPPYNLDALEPYMSQTMLEAHWGGYHRGHVEALNKHLSKSDILYGYTMDELVKVTYNYGNPSPEFNDVAQYPTPTVSQRSNIRAQVLNDHWISVTSGSEITPLNTGAETSMRQVFLDVKMTVLNQRGKASTASHCIKILKPFLICC